MPLRPIRSLPTLLFPLLALCCANTAPAETPQVRVAVVSDVQAIQPGKPFRIAITVSPQPNWHIYWQNPGDSGLPTKVKWTLPPGFSASNLQFPIPHQFTMPGNIIAYGYDTPATFFATITTPNDLKPGDTAAIKGTASWLCCKEECVPGRKEFSLTLPIAQEALPADEPVFKQAHYSMPGDTPSAAQQAADKPDLTKTPDGETITLHLGLPALPCEMFPTAAPDFTLSGITSTPTPAGNDIQFKIHPLAGQPLRTQHLPILVVYTDASAVRPVDSIRPYAGRTAFYLNVNLSGLAPAGHP